MASEQSIVEDPGVATIPRTPESVAVLSAPSTPLEHVLSSFLSAQLHPNDPFYDAVGVLGVTDVVDFVDLSLEDLENHSALSLAQRKRVMHAVSFLQSQPDLFDATVYSLDQDDFHQYRMD